MKYIIENKSYNHNIYDSVVEVLNLEYMKFNFSRHLISLCTHVTIANNNIVYNNIEIVVEVRQKFVFTSLFAYMTI